MKILIAVDMQNDFITGSLAVPGAAEIVAPLVEHARTADLVIATADWHPLNHSSFEGNGGPWPRHCVQGTWGAMLHPEIEAVANMVLHKGMDPATDGYSAFHGTVLGRILTTYWTEDTEVLIGGVATDYCVRATALGASVDHHYRTTLLSDAVRGVAENTTAAALTQLREAGVTIR